MCFACMLGVTYCRQPLGLWTKRKQTSLVPPSIERNRNALVTTYRECMSVSKGSSHNSKRIFSSPTIHMSTFNKLWWSCQATRARILHTSSRCYNWVVVIFECLGNVGTSFKQETIEIYHDVVIHDSRCHIDVYSQVWVVNYFFFAQLTIRYSAKVLYLCLSMITLCL